ncbi:MAG: Gfo/Idh/MocA family oxidoreductase [Candidatus Hydrogenedentes bacterium]|nr:Gfo/Idh/MocA family oxidoreductase [Candidatus Hydrogenedentota bacterium]
MDKVRVGFVGVGGMGQCAHLRNYVALDDCEVVAIAELRQGLAKRVAERYGVPRIYPDHEAMLAEEQLDALVASQPYSRHGVLVPELYKAGVPVLTEKPLARSVEAAEGIVAALGASSARHYVGYHKRSDPATMYARDTIDRLKASGELGALRYVRILMPAGDWIANGFSHLLTSDEPMPPLESDPPPAGMDEDTSNEFNIFVNYYIHQVNLMRHLLGEPYSVSYADPARVLLAVHSASGVPGVIEMSPYQTTIAWQEQALIAFERGYLALELPAPLASNRPGSVTLYRDPGNGATPESITPELPWIHAMRQQAINFIRAVRGAEGDALCQAPEALDDLRVARDYIQMVRGG